MSGPPKRKLQTAEKKIFEKRQKMDLTTRSEQSSLQGKSVFLHEVKFSEDTESVRQSTRKAMHVKRNPTTVKDQGLRKGNHFMIEYRKLAEEPGSPQPSPSTGFSAEGNYFRSGYEKLAEEPESPQPSADTSFAEEAEYFFSREVRTHTSEAPESPRQSTSHGVFARKSLCYVKKGKDQRLREENSRKRKWSYRSPPPPTRSSPCSPVISEWGSSSSSSSSDNDEGFDHIFPGGRESDVSSPVTFESIGPQYESFYGDDEVSEIFEKGISDMSLLDGEHESRSRERQSRSRERHPRSRESVAPQASGASASMSSSSGEHITRIPNIIEHLNCATELTEFWSNKKTLLVQDEDGNPHTAELVVSRTGKNIYAVAGKENAVYSLGHPLDWRAILAISCDALRIPYPLLEVGLLETLIFKPSSSF